MIKILFLDCFNLFKKKINKEEESRDALSYFQFHILFEHQLSDI